MATGKITKEAVEAVPVPASGKRSYLWDATLKGFGIMVTDRGVRSYIVQYRIGGRAAQTERVTIGRHGSPWTAARARERAIELLEQARRGKSPFKAAKEAAAQEKLKQAERAKAAAISERLAFSVFADRFVEKYAKVEQPRSWKETDGIIRRDLKPAFGDRPLTDISDADIVELLDEIGERGPSASLKAYKALRLIFGFACDKERRHLPPARNPMLGVRPPARAGKRERTLTDDELRLCWIAAGGLGWPFGPIVRLLILTMQRRDEVAGLRWPELELEKREWLLPGSRTKNKVANLVHLSDPALAILKDLPVIKSDEKLLFTSTGKTAVSGFSKIKVRLDASMVDLRRKEAIEGGSDEKEAAKLTIPDWTLHDLRRTGATGCERLGIKSPVIEAVLNHVSGSKSGIVGVYQTYKYAEEKKAALDAWANYVTRLVQQPMQSNVVQLAMRA